jgi:hypothetical protein
MQAESDALRDSAIANTLSTIRKQARFPQNVFAQAWDDYLFFESDLVFDGNFIEAKDAILDQEGSSCIALVNLGNAQVDSDPEPRFMFLDRSTTASGYFSMLRGHDSASNWLVLVDRYVCASDKGSWCVYCEKQNEIAVIAIRNTFSPPTLLTLRTSLKAESIRTLFASKKDRIFDKLVPRWRSGLATEYVPRVA